VVAVGQDRRETSHKIIVKTHVGLQNKHEFKEYVTLACFAKEGFLFCFFNTFT
jgi:hypothetical protein